MLRKMLDMIPFPKNSMSANDRLMGSLIDLLFTGFFILEGESRFFEPRNSPEQTASARNVIFCRESYMGILFGPIEAIF